MSKEPFPDDRPGDADPEESAAPGGTSQGGGPPNLEAGFTPTDLSRLFPNSSPDAFNPLEAIQADEPAWMADRAAERENITPRKLLEKRVRVTAVYEQTIFNGARHYFVQLRDDEEREMKVFVGPTEATSISMAAEGWQFRRPLTHDLTKTLVERLGWKIDRILIDDLYNETFYAKLTLSRGDEQIDIDCRPSDAIALALRSRAPIFVAEDVLVAASRDETPPEEGDASE